MYSVTVKGRNLDELKQSVLDINQELQHGIVSGKVTKDLDTSLKDELVQTSKTNEVTLPSPGVSGDAQTEPVQAPVVEAIPNLSAVGIETDSEGLPWDKRIHASSRNQIKDGTWRLKRGVDENLVQEVKAELRQRMIHAANPAQVPPSPVNENTPVVSSPVAPVVESEPIAPTPQPVQAPVVEQVAPTAPVVEPAPVQQTAPAPALPTSGGGHTLQSFKDNMPMIITSMITEEKIDQNYLNSLLQYFGTDQIWKINDTQKQELFENFVQHGLIVKVA